ncbi:MAG: PorV/PorQ family protein [Bacteroidota bacterium]
MIKKLTKIFLIIILFFEINLSQSIFPNLGSQRTGISTFNFLKIGVSPRGIGMSDATIALANDISFLQKNPASAVIEKNNSIYFSHNSWFAETSNEHFSYLHHLSDYDAIAIGVTSFVTDDIQKRTVTMPFGTGEFVSFRDVAFSLTYARVLTDQFRFGVTVKYVNETLAELQAQTFLFDLGALYFINFGSARFAFVLSNFGSTIKPNGEIEQLGIGKTTDFEEFSPPTNFSLGFAFEPIDNETHRVTSSIQLNHPNDNSENFAIGSEYSWRETFFVRTGKKFKIEEQKSFSFGVGVKIPMDVNFVFVDYGVTSIGDLGFTHSISILTKF